VVAVSSRDLTDAQWAVLEPYFASPLPRSDGRGRPWRDARAVLNGVLYVLRTGCAWADLPRCYPPKSTCHDRLQTWIEDGVFEAVLEDLASDLQQVGWLDLRECFIDGTFAPAKRGGPSVGTTKRGKGSKIMAIVEVHGLPVAVTIDSAQPHEIKLVEQRLDGRFVDDEPERLIGDKAYDSDAMDRQLRERGIELIAPHRCHRVNRTQDGRSLRRKKRRYKVERFFAWLQAFRRLLVRWEGKAENYLGFVNLACVLILLRHTL
jgi:transposase